MGEEQQRQEQPEGPLPAYSNITDFVTGAIVGGLTHLMYRPEYDNVAITVFNAALFGSIVGIFKGRRLGKEAGLYSGVASATGSLAGQTFVHILKMYG
ncbi:hypothetical protein HY772_09395 [Candidatus Woesearchaeota archaeon]|nr:hypothetical protein [Candidatus Woesearchaeota archaeon]